MFHSSEACVMKLEDPVDPVPFVLACVLEIEMC